MPEKPEVITVSNSLRPRLVGKEIKECNVYWDNIIAYPTTAIAIAVPPGILIIRSEFDTDL